MFELNNLGLISVEAAAWLKMSNSLVNVIFDISVKCLPDIHLCEMSDFRNCEMKLFLKSYMGFYYCILEFYLKSNNEQTLIHWSLEKKKCVRPLQALLPIIRYLIMNVQNIVSSV